MNEILSPISEYFESASRVAEDMNYCRSFMINQIQAQEKRKQKGKQYFL